MKGDAEMRAIFRRFGPHRDDVFEMLAACVLAGSQATYNEGAGAIMGSPVSGVDVAAGKVVGCLTAGIDKLMIKNHQESDSSGGVRSPAGFHAGICIQRS
jgi:hypothetical protein